MTFGFSGDLRAASGFTAGSGHRGRGRAWPAGSRSAPRSGSRAEERGRRSVPLVVLSGFHIALLVAGGVLLVGALIANRFIPGSAVRRDRAAGELTEPLHV